MNDTEIMESTQQATKLKQSANTNTNQPNQFELIDNYILSETEVNAIAEPEWITKNLIISGHLILIPAEPNAGKTTIFFKLASQMSNKGYQFNYVNTDISGGDAKPLVAKAKKIVLGNAYLSSY